MYCVERIAIISLTKDSNPEIVGLEVWLEGGREGGRGRGERGKGREGERERERDFVAVYCSQVRINLSSIVF